MTIFDYFFSCFKYIINILDNDFFGLGFTYLDFMLGASLGLFILSFLIKGFNEMDRFNLLSIASHSEGILRTVAMKNNNREKQISETRSSGYVSSDLIDVYGDGTYVISKKQYYGKD